MAHGSRYHRRPVQWVQLLRTAYSNKRNYGQMGGNVVTIQNLEIVKVDAERNLLLVKGNVLVLKSSSYS